LYLLEEVVNKDDGCTTEVVASNKVNPRPLVHLLVQRFPDAVDFGAARTILGVLLGSEAAKSRNSVFLTILR
jgi:hypothetical protein